MSPDVQPAGNYYDKYRTANPIARRLMRGFLDAFDSLVERVPVSNALEIGCGEGELSIRLARRGFRVRGCDISADIVGEARRRAHAAGVEASFWPQPIETIDVAAEAAPLVVCCEVLEHVDDPLRAIDALAGLARPHLIASVPREPLWRALNMARGKYLGALGNTPGHVNHWGRGAFLQLMSRRFDILQVRSPLPWTMVLCRRR
ncbi:class I SAM-dependent methyltransferase [Dokdonella fugitiva]|jgi:2-polyprenyl-3-methyl-5-hydroxy-6-metoxy-1,4-benzoquinol methylase|uniref:class I SAM-dependent methyltransferase n=1 Tax=Dokdonella fugitiva TaxID=328517 RepID=UPI0015F82A39|nr:methyltransferase domain-containing protein [Dokdonella fugitiva]MBA8882546.1 2-polyprenyl-3-methyl-5-hydroxy-6-metoxy-1,4-benzoquinol methylase [Dokdonella fugitiva]